MKGNNFAIGLFALILLQSLIRNTGIDDEKGLAERIIRDQDLPLSVYLLDVQEFTSVNSGLIDTMVLYLAPYPNSDTTSAELLKWKLRFLRTSDTKLYVEKAYHGECREEGVVIPKSLSIGSYNDNLSRVEILCGKSRLLFLNGSVLY